MHAYKRFQSENTLKPLLYMHLKLLFLKNRRSSTTLRSGNLGGCAGVKNIS